jgi:hypothetical protein
MVLIGAVLASAAVAALVAMRLVPEARPRVAAHPRPAADMNRELVSTRS